MLKKNEEEMSQTELLYSDITGHIRDCAYRVYRTLGSGFLEKVYENALIAELQDRELQCEQQKAITVYYGHRVVGEYMADILVEGKIIVELKAAKEIDDIHYAQLFNYLKATGHKVGLLINFGPRFIFKRRVFIDNKSASSASSVVNTNLAFSAVRNKTVLIKE